MDFGGAKGFALQDTPHLGVIRFRLCNHFDSDSSTRVPASPDANSEQFIGSYASAALFARSPFLNDSQHCFSVVLQTDRLVNALPHSEGEGASGVGFVGRRGENDHGNTPKKVALKQLIA